MLACKHFGRICAALCAVVMFLTTPALAVHPEEKSELENLKKRIELLEAEQPADAERKPAVDLGRISQYLTLHGLLEVEASYAEPDGGDAESDLTLATAELALVATLNDFVGGHLVLLYEEEEDAEDDLDVDEAVISLTSPGSLLGQTPALHAGRMYVPFGMFNSYMVSDPLTLDLGETQDTAALVALEGDLWNLQLGAFNGDADTHGDNNSIDSWVAAVEFTLGDRLGFGASYLSDLAETDIDLVPDTDLYSSSVPAASAFLSAYYGAFGFEAEFVSALEDFDADVVAIGTDLTGDRPAAWNLELAWMPVADIQLAARYEGAEDFQDDVRRYGATVSYGFHEHALVALEYLYAETDLSEADSVDLVTAQLALEF